MTEIAKRTLPWSGGQVEKGKPVPTEVPEGYLLDWRRRGWLDGEPDVVAEPPSSSATHVEMDVDTASERIGYAASMKQGARKRGKKSGAGRDG